MSQFKEPKSPGGSIEFHSARVFKFVFLVIKCIRFFNCIKVERSGTLI